MAGGYGTFARAGTTPPAGTDADGYAVERGSGLLTFAGTMLAIVGVLNFVYGIAAISNSKFYTQNAHYIISNLNTFGWALLVIGVIQLGAVFSIWAGTEWGRWVGVLTAGVNLIVQLLFLPSRPLAALAVVAIDILVIYGLLAYGGQRGRPAV
jgi:hypothetical protein